MTGWWTTISNRYRRERQFLREMPSFWRFCRAAKRLALLVVLLAVTRFDGSYPAFLLVSTNWRDVLVSVEEQPRVTIVAHQLMGPTGERRSGWVRVRAVLANTTNHPIWFSSGPQAVWQQLTAKTHLYGAMQLDGKPIERFHCMYRAGTAKLKPGRAVWFEDFVWVNSETRHIQVGAPTFWIDRGVESSQLSWSQEVPVTLADSRS